MTASRASMPGQAAALSAMRQSDPAEAYRQNIAGRREYVLDRLSAMGLQAASPAAGYFVWLQAQRGFAETLRREANVSVLPGERCGPWGKGRVRLHFGGDEGRLDAGLARMRDLLIRERITSAAA